MGTEHQTMMKGSEVEVCFQKEGFKDSYFRALLEENLTQSGRKKVSVRFKTLLSDDGSSPLTETVHQKLLRPVPPEEEYSGVVLEEGTVVDAYLREGWWKGVVIKKKTEEEDDDDNYLVYFDSPPDIIMFDKTKLRAHVDWTDSKWFRPQLEELDKSLFCPGTMVEVSSVIDKGEVAWFPAMLIKEIEEDGEKKFIVKDCKHHLSRYGEEARPNTTVDPRRVRPKPPSSSVTEYSLMNCVEVFHGSVWRQGLVKVLLTGQCYRVSLEGTEEEHMFRRSHVRPLKVWEDGAWHDRAKEETPSRGRKTKTVTSKRARKHVRGGSLNPDKNGETLTKAETVVAAATGEVRNKKADVLVIDDETSPPVLTPQVVTPSPPVIAATPLKQTGTETEGQQSSEKTPEPRSKQNGLGNGSTTQKMPEEKEETSQDKSRKRKRGEEQPSDRTCNGSSDVDCQPISSATEISSSSSAAASYGEETPPAALMALPFAKRSPYWKRCEETEGFKSLPQHPHFSPLLEAKDSIREWSAVGMMAVFYSLLETVKSLKPDASLSLLSSLSDSLVELEQYGFDIDAPRSRISKMMSLKDEQAKKAVEKQFLEKKVDEDEKRSRELGEEMAELKRTMLELQRQEAVAKEEKEAADKRVVEMKASGERIEQKIEDVDIEFLNTALAPW